MLKWTEELEPRERKPTWGRGPWMGGLGLWAQRPEALLGGTADPRNGQQLLGEAGISVQGEVQTEPRRTCGHVRQS